MLHNHTHHVRLLQFGLAQFFLCLNMAYKKKQNLKRDLHLQMLTVCIMAISVCKKKNPTTEAHKTLIRTLELDNYQSKSVIGKIHSAYMQTCHFAWFKSSENNLGAVNKVSINTVTELARSEA